MSDQDKKVLTFEDAEKASVDLGLGFKLHPPSGLLTISFRKDALQTPEIIDMPFSDIKGTSATSQIEQLNSPSTFSGYISKLEMKLVNDTTMEIPIGFRISAGCLFHSLDRAPEKDADEIRQRVRLLEMSASSLQDNFRLAIINQVNGSLGSLTQKEMKPVSPVEAVRKPMDFISG